MGVTALAMDVITEKSGHQVTPCAVSVCTTPAAPSPLPIPYPVLATAAEGLSDTALRTKVTGSPVATVGSVFKGCHGNEPGTLKEVVSLNTAGPCFIIMGAPVVLCELGMMGITGSACISNKAPTPGANGTASGAGGAGGGGGGGGGGGAAPAGPGGPSGPSNGGGGGGGGNSGASAAPPGPGDRAAGTNGPAGTSSGPAAQHQCQGGHPVDLVTGAVVDQATDIDLPGAFPFTFRRFYSSTRHRDRSATLGAGWAHGLEQYVMVEAARISLSDEQGRAVFFELVPVGGHSFHRGERLTLIRDGELDFRIVDHARGLTRTHRPTAPGGRSLLQSISDAHGNQQQLVYEEGRLACVRDTVGREIFVRWRGGSITRLEVVVGGSTELWVDYEYDDAGLLVSVTDALGHADELEYDGHGRMSAATIKSGARFQYAYDKDSARCTRTWGPNGLYAIELEYDDVARLTRVFGEESRLIVWSDLYGRASRECTLDGQVLEERAIDSDGYVIALVNGAGEGHKTWFDERGNRVRTIDAENQITAWEYAGDQQTRQIDAEGLVTTFAHDERGLLTRITQPNGASYSFTYDTRGKLSRIDDADGSLFSYEHDAQLNLVAETDARGARTRYAVDALGRVVKKIDALGQATSLERDRLGRITTVNHPDGSRVSRSLDPMGRVVKQVDPLGGVTQVRYAGMGVPVELSDASGRSWRLKYTSHERLAEIKNPAGETTSFVYDEGGRVVEETTFDGRKKRYARGPSGRVDRLTQPDGSTRAFEYDRRGRLLRDSGSDGSALSFRRDRRGLIVEAKRSDATGEHTIQYQRDVMGRIVLESQGDQTIRYSVDAFGRRLERVLPGGSTTRYKYDRRHDLTAIEHDGTRFAFGRDAIGRETTISPESRRFVATYAYDALDRLVSEQVLDHSASADVARAVSRTFEYDALGQLTRSLDERWGLSEYRYDQVGQLLSARVGEHAEAFQYDPCRSLVSALEAASAPPRNARFKVGPGNRLLETATAKYAYDACGRRMGVRDLTSTAGPERITSYQWDVRDRMVGVALADGRRIENRFDAFGRRVLKTVRLPGGSVTRSVSYLWDGHALASETASDGAKQVFVYRPHSLTPLLHQEHGEVFLYMTDHLGTPRELVDKHGRVALSMRFTAHGAVAELQHDPERELAGRSPSTPLRFNGHVADEETGLSFTRFRVFDHRVGRWLSPDPLEFAGGLNANGLDFAPTNAVDPLGLTEGAAGHGAAPVSPEIDPRDVAGKKPAEIDALAKEKGLIPKGDPMSGNGSYVDPVTGQQRVLIHPTPKNGDPAHSHVNNPQGERLDIDGNVVPAESKPAHLGLDMS